MENLPRGFVRLDSPGSGSRGRLARPVISVTEGRQCSPLIIRPRLV